MKRTYLEGVAGLRDEVEHITRSMRIDVDVTIENALIFNGEGNTQTSTFVDSVLIDREFLIDRRPSGKFCAFRLNLRKGGFTRIKRPSGERIDSDAELRFAVIVALQVLIFDRGSKLSKNVLPTLAEQRESPPADAGQ